MLVDERPGLDGVDGHHEEDPKHQSAELRSPLSMKLSRYLSLSLYQSSTSNLSSLCLSPLRATTGKLASIIIPGVALASHSHTLSYSLSLTHSLTSKRNLQQNPSQNFRGKTLRTSKAHTRTKKKRCGREGGRPHLSPGRREAHRSLRQGVTNCDWQA